MPPIEILLAFTAAALVMNLSPGPSNLYVLARTLGQGASGGLVAALGLAAGSLVHVLATVLGLAAIFQYSPLAYTAIKLLGAAYLIYLGVSYLRAPAVEAKGQAAVALPLATIFRQSVLVEVTNPKTALFFLALLPQFADATYGALAPQLLLLGVIVTLTALPCDLLVVFAAARVSQWMAVNPRAQLWQERVSGTLLCGLGGWLLWDEGAGA
jgi:threonine/homoserine/homoserine lactone efflux protein